MMKLKSVILFFALVAMIASCSQKPAITPEEARAIAKEAYIYAYPMVDGYRIQHAYFLDPANPEFKAPYNQLSSMARVYTPADKAVQTPNSDTPYSMAGLDLRQEPVVITIPPIEEGRYFSVQLIDLYTFNFDYIGSRTTGNGGGNYLVHGPSWKGEVPQGISKVFAAETELASLIFRTQLFKPDDLEQVKEIQSRYKVQPLSAFTGQPAPTPVATSFAAPLKPGDIKTSLEVFNQLNFILQFCPVHPSEKELMERFAKLGIGAGRSIDFASLEPEIREAMENGIKDAWSDFGDLKQTKIDTHEVTGKDVFGTREHLANNYLYRMAAAIIGIYGNSAQEAMYPIYLTDDGGQPLTGANRYALRFAPGMLPPVNAFWSVTMYELPTSLLTENPINRYLINSPMLPALKTDKDGGLTIYIQNASPGAKMESNWLPAPQGPFMVVMRLYWPKPEALSGSWKNPPIQKTN
jgi:hypothetical protein